MITNFFLNLGYQIGNTILGWFTTVNVSTSELGNAIEHFIPIWSSWNKILPLDTLLTIFAVVITIELGVLIFRIITWINPPYVPLKPHF